MKQYKVKDFFIKNDIEVGDYVRANNVYSRGLNADESFLVVHKYSTKFGRDIYIDYIDIINEYGETLTGLFSFDFEIDINKKRNKIIDNILEQ